jgi:hypothetical protein
MAAWKKAALLAIIAAAPAEGPERERLLRKKELIEASIERLVR